jgi:hypothetical protein
MTIDDAIAALRAATIARGSSFHLFSYPSIGEGGCACSCSATVRDDPRGLPIARGTAYYDEAETLVHDPLALAVERCLADLAAKTARRDE